MPCIAEEIDRQKAIPLSKKAPTLSDLDYRDTPVVHDAGFFWLGGPRDTPGGPKTAIIVRGVSGAFGITDETTQQITRDAFVRNLGPGFIVEVDEP